MIYLRTPFFQFISSCLNGSHRTGFVFFCMLLIIFFSFLFFPINTSATPYCPVLFGVALFSLPLLKISFIHWPFFSVLHTTQMDFSKHFFGLIFSFALFVRNTLAAIETNKLSFRLEWISHTTKNLATFTHTC